MSAFICFEHFTGLLVEIGLSKATADTLDSPLFTLNYNNWYNTLRLHVCTESAFTVTLLQFNNFFVAIAFAKSANCTPAKRYSYGNLAIEKEVNIGNSMRLFILSSCKRKHLWILGKEKISLNGIVCRGQMIEFNSVPIVVYWNVTACVCIPTHWKLTEFGERHGFKAIYNIENFD